MRARPGGTRALGAQFARPPAWKAGLGRRFSLLLSCGRRERLVWRRWRNARIGRRRDEVVQGDLPVTTLPLCVGVAQPLPAKIPFQSRRFQSHPDQHDCRKADSTTVHCERRSLGRRLRALERICSFLCLRKVVALCVLLSARTVLDTWNKVA
nr:uncharacterized protein LOC110549994 [Meriones unguiculatus]